MIEAKEVGKAPNSAVQESVNISAPRAAWKYLLADLESP
jgi:hypothetical protein